jgi:hypothetical protein
MKQTHATLNASTTASRFAASAFSVFGRDATSLSLGGPVPGAQPASTSVGRGLGLGGGGYGRAKGFLVLVWLKGL